MLRTRSLARSPRVLGIFLLKSMIAGERESEEMRNLWKTKVKGSAWVSPLFMTDQFELQRRTTMKKSSQFLRRFNQASSASL